VELAAEIRFARLADRLAGAGAPEALVTLARQASTQERTHAGYCATLAVAYGHAPPPADEKTLVGEAAPAGMTTRERLVYEVVAASCVAETESMTTLTTLLDRVTEPRLREILRELASDEVNHSRLGWGYLAFEHARGPVAFLSGLMPRMLSSVIPEGMYGPPPPEREVHELLAHGVLTHTLRKDLFAATLNEVILPGLERYGVDTAPARGWLGCPAERLSE
jgi:hypothetical protein